MRTRTWGRVAALATVVPVSSACGSGSSEARGYTVADSAGIRVVTSDVPFWSEADRWTVGAEAEVSIGLTSGAPEYIFTTIEGATWLPDGRIVVADHPSNEIRYYDPDGRFLYKAGGSGRGPGEFGRLRAVMRCGEDVIHGFDGSWEVSVFSAIGEFLLTVELDLPESFTARRPYDLSCSREGQFSVNGWGREVLGRRTPGPYRTTSPVAVLDADGTPLAEVGEFPGAERLQDAGTPYPLGKRLVHALTATRLYVGTADDYEIRVFDLAGKLLAIYRKRSVLRPYDQAVLEAWAQTELERRGPDARRDVEWIRRLVLKYDQPKTVAAYSRFLIDEKGHLWVEDFTLPGEERRTWSVFHLDGVWLGVVDVPARLEIAEIAHDRILARTRDQVGVERVVIHALRKKP